MKRRLALLVAAAALVMPAGLASATDTSTPGTWEQYPTGATEYQADVQQPINSANTSNWSSKSKGAIPVMFKLSSRQGPAAFESILSDATDANDYAFMSFTPSSPLLFSEVTQLKTDYAFTLGDCHGGALRWSVRVSATQSVFIYYGEAPNFTDCTTSNQSGVNMIGQPDLRYDTSQVGGTFYDTYAHALTLVGSMPIVRASLVIDGGWAGDQRLTVSNTTVNGNAYQFVTSAGGGAFAPTCSLPAATINVARLDPTPDGDLNEEAVNPQVYDTGTSFRVVDCKYLYNLAIPSLAVKGTYRVEILLDSVVAGSARFDLK
ncbi:MAG TPA: hypothetical protein VGJ71_04985 [Candidatus Limnocylindrales bacterium]|jgi:hypothetical protein